MTLRVKNWSSFQHYKKRNPPWIKLHRSTLDDCKFQRLPVESRALAPMIWLLASESKDGSVSGDCGELAWRLRISEDEVNKGLNPLIEAGFLESEKCASNALAGRYQDATPETERETEEESETDGPSLVFQIATTYPKASHYRNELELPPALADAIIQAIDKDGPETVLRGTHEFAAHCDNPAFAPDPYKFFKEFQYRRKYAATKPVSKFDQLGELLAADAEDERELEQFHPGPRPVPRSGQGVPKTV